MTGPVLRFAPSPNGRLHLGHALSALLNFEMARDAGGRFLLRIEDIDVGRARPEFEQAIYEDLAWLGIAWEEPVRRQSEHFSDYEAALKTLKAQGLVYRSVATRKEIADEIASREAKDGKPWPRDPDGAPLYPFEPGDAPAGDAPPAWRLDMRAAIDRIGQPLSWQETGAGPDGETGEVAARPQAWGDVLVARKEVPTSYHLSVVVDDALEGVTHVVRGRDLFWSTSVHRLLQGLLGLPAPVYRHHRLILDDDGRKLSKSRRDTSLSELRAAGATPADIRRMVRL
ncbi:glutamyl-Q tRNA(Asp) synthetase [Rhodobium orientis]|uniref:tRNA glutamyl-Q(34) synthetase GluQRS n=1 Tax=Rhodobium orientis TaxID=34017 RepID=A0A327JRF3_9HYPH|nr:tRNA glutamyl-Q(34) synthetase GluQRS [Rhodobium orientis]MBB4304329.1 glutamyl-Q tRNA(Asp) synthetase [Rhodobium orientis]MBK5948177.1 tRNA glutamyl-Q(34) synthetase GluQRS [Rhodobium orientis]RAI28867.1 tRNA glutamyl-Q(34) synthetase GluQRS [Rhodobium orientis]